MTKSFSRFLRGLVLAMAGFLGLGCGNSGNSGNSGSNADSGSSATTSAGETCVSSAFGCGCGDPTPVIGNAAKECSKADFDGASVCCNWGGTARQCQCAKYVCYMNTFGECECVWGPANAVGSGLPIGATQLVTSCSPPDGGTCCSISQAIIDQSYPGSGAGNLSTSCTCSSRTSCSSNEAVDHCGTDNPPSACPTVVPKVTSCP